MVWHCTHSKLFRPLRMHWLTLQQILQKIQTAICNWCKFALSPSPEYHRKSFNTQGFKHNILVLAVMFCK